jgi:hypothetical protein
MNDGWESEGKGKRGRNHGENSTVCYIKYCENFDTEISVQRVETSAQRTETLVQR